VRQALSHLPATNSAMLFTFEKVSTLKSSSSIVISNCSSRPTTISKRFTESIPYASIKSASSGMSSRGDIQEQPLNDHLLDLWLEFRC